VAQAAVSRSWHRAHNADRPALAIFAVSVRDSFSPDVNDRLRLMKAVADRFAPTVPRGLASLWVFPGGYFGYSAAQGRWRDLRAATRDRIRRAVFAIARRFPAPSLIAVGVDGYAYQQAWLVKRYGSRVDVSEITRRESSLAERQFTIGPARVAFFICGEFTGSHTHANGPFCDDGESPVEYLDNPARQLRECDVLVDLAHLKVSGSISGTCSPRMVHRRQMERFARQGVAVLTHHHAGQRANGREHYKHQSNWIVFRGGKWLPPSEVDVIE
jgi:hypothetical protein